METRNVLTQIERVGLEDWAIEESELTYSLFVSPQWIESAANEMCRPIYLDFKQRDRLVAKTAGLEVYGNKLVGTQLYFYSCPAFVDNRSEVHVECYEALLRFAKQNGYSRISIRPFDQTVSEKAEVDGFRIYPSHEYRVLFREQSEKGFSYGFKQNVKKARKAGAVFHQSSSPELLPKLIELLGVTQQVRTGKYGEIYDPMGILNLNENTLSRLIGTGSVRFYYATIQDEVVSVQLNFEIGDRTFGFLMGSSGEAYKKGVPSFIDFNILETVQERGLTLYNLGGTVSGEAGGEGLSRYKESLGAVRIPTFGYYSPYLGVRYYLIAPALWLARMAVSWPLVRRLQIYAVRKGWIG